MSWLNKLVGTAAAVELALMAAGLVLSGLPAMIAALVGSTVAVGAQVGAVVMLRPGMAAPGKEFVKRWTGGIALRMASFVVIAVLIIATRNVLPPLWMAAGYLVQMLTLLFAETVFLK